MLEWPLADLLSAYRLTLAEALLAQYRHDELVWASIAPHVTEQPPHPTLPELLRE